MKKTIAGSAKNSSGKVAWLMMPDGSFYISRQAVEDATIQHVKLRT
jgi:hypothetical protein